MRCGSHAQPGESAPVSAVSEALTWNMSPEARLSVPTTIQQFPAIYGMAAQLVYVKASHEKNLLVEKLGALFGIELQILKCALHERARRERLHCDHRPHSEKLLRTT